MLTIRLFPYDRCAHSGEPHFRGRHRYGHHFELEFDSFTLYLRVGNWDWYSHNMGE
jgi:hypothetical protein